jgi:predicted MFS family arabinose efflux permease
MATVSGSRKRGIRPVLAALACTAVGVLPVNLFAGLAPLIRREFDFPASWIGVGVSIAFGASAVSSLHAGRLSERLGAKRALRLGLVLSATALAIIGLVADARPLLAVALAIGGLGNAVIQPAANLTLAQGAPAERLGLVFGIKQSAIPIAAAMGGFAVPLVGLTIGWRAAFVAVGAAALLLLLLPADTAPPSRTDGADAPRPAVARLDAVPRSLWLLTGTIALGAAAATGMSSYLVESSIDAGWPIGLAGSFLGIGSVLGIVARLTVGWWSDRRQDDGLALVGAMMAVGTFGFVLLMFPERPLALLLGVPTAFAAGWGYNGLFIRAVVRLHPETPAASTGIFQIGSFSGPTLGPTLFGAVAAVAGYRTAWATMALLAAGSAVLLQVARRQVARERAGA